MNEFDKARKELLQHYSRVIQVLNDSTLLDSLGFVEVNMMRLGNEISKLHNSVVNILGEPNPDTGASLLDDTSIGVPFLDLEPFK